MTPEEQYEMERLKRDLKDAIRIACNRRDKVNKHISISRMYEKQCSNLNKEVEELKKKLQQTEIHCEIREKALYEVRQLVEPGSEISKIAGRALCYGNYTRK